MPDEADFALPSGGRGYDPDNSLTCRVGRANRAGGGTSVAGAVFSPQS